MDEQNLEEYDDMDLREAWNNAIERHIDNRLEAALIGKRKWEALDKYVEQRVLDILSQTLK